MKVHSSLGACIGCAWAQMKVRSSPMKSSYLKPETTKKKKKCYKMSSLPPVLSLMSPAKQARSTKKSKTRWRKGEKDSWSPNRWDPSSWWNRHLHSVQCPPCKAAIIASGTFDFYLLGPLWESVTWKQQSRRARYGQCRNVESGSSVKPWICLACVLHCIMVIHPDVCHIGLEGIFSQDARRVLCNQVLYVV